jgi:hypothetical protein
VWAVNDDEEYHEVAGGAANGLSGQLAALRCSQPMVPRRVDAAR